MILARDVVAGVEYGFTGTPASGMAPQPLVLRWLDGAGRQIGKDVSPAKAPSGAVRVEVHSTAAQDSLAVAEALRYVLP